MQLVENYKNEETGDFQMDKQILDVLKDIKTNQLMGIQQTRELLNEIRRLNGNIKRN